MPLFEDEAPLSGAVHHLDVGRWEVIVARAESERELDDGLNGGVVGSFELVTKWPVREPVTILEILRTINSTRVT